ncbi:hypothetical protein SAMN05216330_104457 [Bradyrhizobium sp. Ghvi]|uniref:DUF5681 domain-containing protein n=1 Tax=Bradyrhizobium sp. Ghvi TaxID=1855319 RepID=UPI0008EE651A|nr:DUF5681 domain-containing protein [Bradyrhizobium sp. Ghvi]SFO74334.1 hypothetical protein SAMN05216330_104457 [Bradyrhizobium sp. Ghvi]
MVKSPEKTAPKQRGRRFLPGQSGNPSGRPKGARNATTLAVEALLDGEAQTLTRKAIELAKDGDLTALRLCLERICPPRKDRPVPFASPAISTAADAVKAVAAIVQAVGAGELTPSEAGELTKIVEGYARILEVADHEERLKKLEGLQSERLR